MKKVNYLDIADKIQNQLPKGAFLTVKDNDANLNTMTIAWGSLGYMWRKPVFIAMIRHSRHTHKILQNAQDFTVNFPTKGQLVEELKICGTKSGRDIDKFKECNLTTIPGKDVNTPTIKECDINLECRILLKQDTDESGLSPEIKASYGENKDYHVFYFGEIVNCLVAD